MAATSLFPEPCDAASNEQKSCDVLMWDCPRVDLVWCYETVPFPCCCLFGRLLQQEDWCVFSHPFRDTDSARCPHAEKRKSRRFVSVSVGIIWLFSFQAVRKERVLSLTKCVLNTETNDFHMFRVLCGTSCLSLNTERTTMLFLRNARDVMEEYENKKENSCIRDPWRVWQQTVSGCCVHATTFFEKAGLKEHHIDGSPTVSLWQMVFRQFSCKQWGFGVVRQCSLLTLSFDVLIPLFLHALDFGWESWGDRKSVV